MIWLIICTGALALEIFTRIFFTIWFAFGAAILILKLFRQYAIKSYTHKTNLNELMDKGAIAYLMRYQ